MTETIIQAQELSRWYGIVVGLNHVSFAVRSGLTGLVGPNGAGKSTLIQIITGQLQPSSGELTVFGQRPWNNPKLLGRLGYCPESEAVPEDLTAVDWLIGLGRLSGLPRRGAAQRAETLLEQVKLERAVWTKRMGQYSKGMRQRAKLAQAMMHRPDILIMDEPMNGLDPMGRQEMTQVLKDLAGQGTHILISSHILPELENLCRQILILNWGRVVASGSQGEIGADLRQRSESIVIRCDQPERLVRLLMETDLLLGFDLEGDGRVVIRLRAVEAFYQQWSDLILQSGLVIYEMRSLDRSLSRIFDKVTA